MHSQLTVEETLMTSAQLRLSKVKDTKIGGDGLRGVSGGERKRTSTGIGLVTDPEILVLDEPTPGLWIHFQQR